MFPSGSTGRPKGVEIPPRSLVNFLAAMQAELGLTVKDTLLADTTTSFDIAGLELYLPLTVGSRVVLGSRDDARDGRRLEGNLARAHATERQATPTTWRRLTYPGWAG